MADKAAALDAVYRDYEQIEVLRGLARGQCLVRGAGPLDAPVVLIGEAPGAVEEERGEPFTGPAGQELQRLCRRADLPWGFCYRANVVPWRPPGNRTPYPFEIAASVSRLAREITIIEPLIVIAAGAVAWKGVSGHKMAPYPDARGRWFTWAPGSGGFSCDLLAIWHPAAILYASGEKQERMRDETVTALKSIFGSDRVV